MPRGWIAVVVTVLYPVAVYFGQARFEPRIMVCLLAVVVLARARAIRGALGIGWLLGACALGAAVLLSNSALPLKLYPVLVNGALLAAFLWGLYSPPTVIERMARLRHADLPPAAIAYMRRVTVVWCGFFVINGSIALYTALFASLRTWSLYNGLIAYALMGLLFAGEYLVRLRVMEAQSRVSRE